MRLKTRLSRLEQKKGINGVLMAFIGVPEDAGDVFDEAQNFWDKEKVNYPHDNVRSAVPLPSYSGKETKFLGLGTQDDLYFGLCGGVRDTGENRFVFFADIAELIKKHWRDVKMVMNTPKKNWGDLYSR